MSEYHVLKNGKLKRVSETKEDPAGNRPRNPDGTPIYHRPGEAVHQPDKDQVKES